MHSFKKLLKTFSPDSQIRGKQFEKLCKWYLETSPIYKSKLEKVWLWDDWPERWGPDCGIDLIAKDVNGELWAVQAKCYSESSSVTKRDIDSFLSESTNPKIGRRLLIATTDSIAPNAYKVIERQNQLIGTYVVLLNDLLRSNIIWPNDLEAMKQTKIMEKARPRGHQKLAIRKVREGLKERGQLVMACGTGKTLTGLWITEELQPNTTLILLPSLLLLSKTLKEWLEHRKFDFEYIPVCSDETVTKSDDVSEISQSEIGYPVTTDSKEIVKFLQNRKRKVIFSTYQSIQKIIEALKISGHTIDLMIADEAHRLAGLSSSTNSLALSDKLIPCRKRLFMTATPRIYKSGQKNKKRGTDIEIMSMDDESTFGPVLYNYSFRDAISNKDLTDYKVIVVGITSSSVRKLIENRELVTTENKLITDAETLASSIGILKSINKYNLQKIITFHTRIKNAKNFAKLLPKVLDWTSNDPVLGKTLSADYVSGKMHTNDRNKRIQKLEKTAYDHCQVLSNSRCLSEGVDVPALDGISFVDPKNSEIDIVQAVGRVIRKSSDKSFGYIVIPVFLGENEDDETAIANTSFSKIWSVISALRSHDKLLGGELDGFRTRLGQRGSVKIPEKIIIDFPHEISRNFYSALSIKLVKCTTQIWYEWYGALKMYVTENGNCLPPARTKQFGKYDLGSWASIQRTNKNNLDLEQIKLLDDIGFIWDVNEFQWNNAIRLLKNYKDEYGDTLVPQDFKSGKDKFGLGSWVSRVRQEKNSLSKNQIDQLDALDFIWDLKDYRLRNGLRELKKFRSENPNRWPRKTDVSASGFKYTSFETFLKNNRKSLPQYVTDELDKLDYVFDRKQKKWDIGFQHFRTYIIKNDDSYVPDKCILECGFNLSSWVKRQRTDFSKGILSAERFTLLDSVGFDWNGKLNADFMMGYQAFLEFKKSNPNSDPDRNFITDSGFHLGAWISKKRHAVKSGKLKSEYVKLLEDAGIILSVKDHKWWLGFDKFEEYIEEYGKHPAETTIYKGYNLGRWLSNCRQRWSNYDGKRIESLTRVGFFNKAKFGSNSKLNE
jgi:superfamily II DNA or RNA helicase